MLSRLRSMSLPTLLLLANVAICWKLFGLEFGAYMGSVEGSYMAIGQWMMRHWPNIFWFPLWFDGLPLHRLYQPGLHVTVALTSVVSGWTIQHAYHFLTAAAYAIGPVSLFCLCWDTSRERGWAFFTALLCTLLSPVCWLAPSIRMDAGGWMALRRFQILTEYGEGPHVAAVALIPVVALLYRRAIREGAGWTAVAAILGVAAVLLTNWPGSIGLAMMLAAVVLAVDWNRFSGKRAIGVPLAGYLIAAPWMPPAMLADVVLNARASDGSAFGVREGLTVCLLVVLVAGLSRILSSVGAREHVKIFIFLSTLTGASVLGWEWIGLRLLPQAWRFQVELDLALSGVLAWAILAGLHRLPRTVRIPAAAAMGLMLVLQLMSTLSQAEARVRPIDIEETAEFQMSNVVAARFGQERVFMPGSVSLWMALFAEVPQTAGCCDQGVPSSAHRFAFFTIYSGDEWGERNADASVLWLKALGANAVGVNGPGSGAGIRPFARWTKFDGVLPEIWRDGENVLYQVPRTSPDPVRVIPSAALPQKAPIHGLDTAELAVLVAALEDPSMPVARWRWVNEEAASIDATVNREQAIYIQVSYDDGWRAIQDGVEIPVIRDPLGLMYVEPRTSGTVHIQLSYQHPHWPWALTMLGIMGTIWLARREDFLHK